MRSLKDTSSKVDQQNTTIASLATNPLQYDRDDLLWTAEGSKGSYNRKLYLQALQPLLRTIKGQHVLEIGCGQGWLCDEIVKHGGTVVGIEPSIKNVQAAHNEYPDLRIERVALQDFKADERFDIATAIMVLEHFLDLEETLRILASLLKSGGKFITIVGDFVKFTNGYRDHPMEMEALENGEIAIRVDYGERAGIICDIIRTTDRYKEVAERAGLTFTAQTPLLPMPWHPRYETHKGKPLFQLLEFVKK